MHTTKTETRNLGNRLKQALVIGFGSGIRGDDAFGPRVAEVLELQLHGASGGVTVRTCQGLTPDLALDIAQTDMVIFVDCAVGSTPGEIRHEVIEAQNDMSLSMVHFLSPPALMTWCQTLYDQRPIAHLFSVTGESYEISDTLTPVVEQAVEKVFRSILQLLAEHGLGLKEPCGA